MTGEVFEDIVINQRIHEHAFENDKPSPNGSYDKYIRDHWNGRHPFTQAEVFDGFAYYTERARQAKMLYTSGKLVHSWLHALYVLRRCKSFRIADWKEGEKPYPPAPAHIKCVVAHHSHDSDHERKHCYELSTANGATPYLAAMTALVASKREIESLEIVCKLHSVLDWATKSQPNLWKINSLRYLNLSPTVLTIHNVSQQLSRTEHHQIENDGDLFPFIGEIFNGCADSIDTLTINTDVLFPHTHWSSPERFVAFPKLRHLRIGFPATIHLRSMALQLEKMESLLYLELYRPCCDADGAIRIEDFYVFFTAIRNHKNRMQVELEIPYHHRTRTRFNLSHHTNTDGSQVKRAYGWTKLQLSLAHYLSGTGPFNNTMYSSYYDYSSDSDTGDD